MKIELEAFGGEVPRVAPHLLPDQNAQLAQNVRLLSGTIDPLHAPLNVFFHGTYIQSIFRYDPYGAGAQPKFLAWPYDTEVVSSVIPGDTLQRVFWTDGEYPKQGNIQIIDFAGQQLKVYPQSYPLGMPLPPDAPGWTLAGSPPPINVVTKTYVYCWENDGYLGAKSAAVSVAVGTNQAVLLTGLDTDPPNNFKGKAVGSNTWQKWIFAADPVVANQYVLLAKIGYGEEAYQDNGTATSAVRKNSQFGKAGIPAPAGGFTGAALSASGAAIKSREYIYCFTWVRDGISYRSAASGSVVVSNATVADNVWIRGMATSPGAAWPSGSTQKFKTIFRKDDAGVYRRVAKVSLAQTDYKDTVKALGNPVSSWTLSGSFGSPAAPTADIDGDTSQLDLQTRYYIYTYVSSYGEESANSPPSSKMQIAPYQSATVYSGGQPAGYQYILYKRLYRTDSSGNYRLVYDNIPINTWAVQDDVDDEALGEPLRTSTWTPPPAGMRGLTAMPNGILAGFERNRIRFSEPQIPYAWPTEYELTTEWDVVALGMSANGLVVATKGSPYLCQGTDPASMSLFKLDVQQACIAAKSMVDMGDYVIYASPDGLVAVSGTEVQLITDAVITRDQWQVYNPSSIRAYFYNGLYIAFYYNGNYGGFIFNPKDRTFSRQTIYAHSAYNDLISDTLYLGFANSYIAKFDAGINYTGTWKSKRYLFSNAITPSAAKVVASNYPVSFKYYVGGVLKATISVTNDRPFRLPSGFRGKEFEYVIDSQYSIRKVAIASSMGEIQ